MDLILVTSAATLGFAPEDWKGVPLRVSRGGDYNVPTAVRVFHQVFTRFCGKGMLGGRGVTDSMRFGCAADRIG